MPAVISCVLEAKTKGQSTNFTSQNATIKNIPKYSFLSLISKNFLLLLYNSGTVHRWVKGRNAKAIDAHFSEPSK